MTTSTAVIEPDTSSYRLPRTVVPEKYEIKLIPDLVNFTFQGEETISTTFAEPVSQIVLNQAELEVLEAELFNARNQSFSLQISHDHENERVTFTLPEKVDSGSWSLKLKFSGILNDKLHGFYRSTYVTPEGEQKVIATTQFEPTDARRAFPCFDEPDFKAVFKITLLVDRHLTAISNAPIESERLLQEKDFSDSNLQQNLKEVVFKDTIKMSTYLVAFIVGEFEASERRMADHTPICIWSRPGKTHLTKFSLDIAQHALSFFNNYYGLYYPGDKLDLIAVPDFAFGAMENLGAVTFRESALLIDENTASHQELERIADVVSHEIAHMWFGDLATMKWWNGLWLNEAFATFMEMLSVDAWKPHWRRWDAFAVSRAAAFYTDSLASTRTIEFPVHHPSDAEAMFDVLTYEKGGSVLRMLEQYLSPDVFRRGVGLYLSKHKYSNAETTDLWDAIEQSSKQPVREMMDSWIFQEGHPIVSAEIVNETASTICLKLSQERFLFQCGEANCSKDTIFQIPVMIKAAVTHADGRHEIIHHKTLLTEKTQTVTIAEGAKLDYAVVNEDSNGFYRVHYSADMLEALTSDLSNRLTAIERFNLVNDAWAQVLAGILNLSSYIDLIVKFKNETDKNVWTIIVNSLNYLHRALGAGKHTAFEKWVAELTGPALDTIGVEPDSNKDEDENSRQVRALLVQALGSLGADAEVIQRCEGLYRKFLDHETSVSPDLVPALLNVLATNGNEERYNEFVDAYKQAKTPQIEDRYMYALAAFKQEALLLETLKKTINGEVRTQNAPYLVRHVLYNVWGRDVSWKFVKDNWSKMVEKFPSVSFGRMFEGVSGLVRADLLTDVRQFFAEHEVKQAKKAIKQHTEKLAVAVAFLAREEQTLNKLKG